MEQGKTLMCLLLFHGLASGASEKSEQIHDSTCGSASARRSTSASVL